MGKGLINYKDKAFYYNGNGNGNERKALPDAVHNMNATKFMF